MFGYVRPFKPEMKIREFRQYKAVYCELCRVLGKEYGILSRAMLSFDLTFYALLSLSVSGAPITEEDRRCVMNPLKKCTYLPSPGEDYSRAAALTVLLTREKLRDTAEDEGFLKSIFARLFMRVLRRRAKKAGERFPAISELTSAFIPAQQEAEKNGLGIDACAEPTAALLRDVCGLLAGEDGDNRAVLMELGYFLGRWVYLMDAADDLEKDLKSGSYNPFVEKLGLDYGETLTDERRDEIALSLNETLNANVARMSLSLNLLKPGNFREIIDNVINEGLPEVQREILFLRVKEKSKKRFKGEKL